MRKAFEGKNYGLFFHFIAPKLAKNTPVEEWDSYVDSFNVKKLAEQVHELNAGYAFITLGQNSGFYCMPSKVYDEQVLPGRCSKRDVPLEFMQELAKYGIDGYIYSTSLPAYCDEPIMEKMQAVPPWNSSMHARPYQEVKHLACDDPRLKHFQSIWNALHTELSTRYGKLCKGWWIDGAYYANHLYDFKDEPNGHTFCRALRAGNPDAVVAFNPGVMKPRRNYPGSDEDYTAGETDYPDVNILCGDTVDGLRYHVLTFAGVSWKGTPLRFTAEQLVSITRTLSDNGCAVTWDLPFGLDGIDDKIFAELKRFAELYKENLKTVPALRINAVPPTCRSEGYVEFITKTPGTVKVLWNGKEETVQVPGKAALPFFAPGEHLLEILQGNFKRSMRIVCGSPEFTLPFTKETKDTSCRLEKENGKLKFSFRVKQPGEMIRNPYFFACTGMEIYIQTESGEDRQYFAYENGELIKVGFGIPHTPLGKAVTTRTPDGYTLEFALPLPEGKSFRLEITTHVSNAENRHCSENMFGGAGSGFMKQYLYALIHQ